MPVATGTQWLEILPSRHQNHFDRNTHEEIFDPVADLLATPDLAGMFLVTELVVVTYTFAISPTFLVELRVVRAGVSTEVSSLRFR